MLLPRFNLRTILAITTVAALFFLIVGIGYRGQAWAWGATIGILSLGITALVHATSFGIVWCFARVATARTNSPGRDPIGIAVEEATQ